MTGPPHLDMMQQIHAMLLLEFKLCEPIARCGDDCVRVGYVIFEPLLE